MNSQRGRWVCWKLKNTCSKSGLIRNTYTRYHICLIRVLIILLSIRYNVCTCHSPIYHHITATAVYLIQRFITACVVVMWWHSLYLSRMDSQCVHFVCCKATSTRWNKTETCCRYLSIFYHFRLVVYESRARRPGPFRPRISPWVRGHGCRQGETGALPPRGHALVEAQAKAGCSGAADSFFVAVRKRKGHFIVGMKILTDIILADRRGTFQGASSARGERYRASGRKSATSDGCLLYTSPSPRD